MANATYKPTTPMVTTAKKATGTGAPLMSTLTSAGAVRIAATTAASTTLWTGTRLAFSVRQYLWPGTAPSRLNANSIRVVLVMQAVVQKNCPAAEMASTSTCQFLPSAWPKMASTGPPALVTPSTLWTAKRKDSSRIQPPIAE